MSFAFYYDVPGDEHIYAKVKAEIGDEDPKGLLVQMVAQRAEGGLRHFNVWESKADWERFFDERVQPAVASVLRTFGLTEPPPPPTIEVVELVDLIVPA